jgi:signal transduction histidine kinase
MIEQCDAAGRVIVCNHGPLFPDDFKTRIFEKFAQADTSGTRQKGGSGLGLNIARKIIVELGGSVGAQAVRST